MPMVQPPPMPMPGFGSMHAPQRITSHHENGQYTINRPFDLKRSLRLRPLPTPPTQPDMCVRVCVGVFVCFLPLFLVYICRHPPCMRSRQAVKKANRSSCASCAVAAGAVDAAEVRGADSLAAAAASAAAAAAAVAAAGGNSHRVAFFRGVPSPRRQEQSGRRAAAAAAAREAEGRGVGRAVPFVATGPGEGSYNVVSAVSKAMRTARRGRPREVREVWTAAEALAWGGHVWKAPSLSSMFSFSNTR